MSEIDPALVRRAQLGDGAAFTALVEADWQRLVRLARPVVGEEEAEDLVQEGLLLVWRKLPGLSDPAAYRAWVARLVLRLCLRRARRHRPVLPLSAVAEPRRHSAPEARLDVERLLRALAPRQRAVMHLTVVEGMSDGEIAAVLGLTAAGVRSHRRRARQRLARQLAKVAPTAGAAPVAAVSPGMPREGA